MPIFEYKAYTENGQPRQGIIDADSPTAARLKLRAERVHVYEIDAIDSHDSKKKTKSIKLGRGNLGELAIVTRQFATLLGAGITAVDALKALIDQVESRAMEQVFRDVREKVTQGETLGEAMAHHPAFFSDLYVNMVKAGEQSGSLDQIMQRLADYLQKQNRMRNKVGAAMAYPIIMAVIGSAVVAVLLTVVVPRIQDIFRESEQALPATTQLLIDASGFLISYWWAILLFIAAVITSWRAWLATENGRLAWDGFMLKLPIFGILYRKQTIARFSTTMATLLKAGLPVLQSLKIVQNVIQNKLFAHALEGIHSSIVEGSDISTPLSKSGIFPPMVGYMIATGEQSGQLETILFKVSEAYDEEVDIATAKLTATLEPMIIVVLALIVGFIVISIVQPLIQMSGIG
jgi:general secretion pathway protein F